MQTALICIDLDPHFRVGSPNEYFHSWETYVHFEFMIDMSVEFQAICWTF